MAQAASRELVGKYFNKHLVSASEDTTYKLIISLAYQKQGYPLENLSKLDAIGTLPPQEGCNAAIEFSGALASMDMKQASFVFKNLGLGVSARG